MGVAKMLLLLCLLELDLKFWRLGGDDVAVRAARHGGGCPPCGAVYSMMPAAAMMRPSSRRGLFIFVGERRPGASVDLLSC